MDLTVPKSTPCSNKIEGISGVPHLEHKHTASFCTIHIFHHMGDSGILGRIEAIYYTES
jgi:hypothetical protein